MSGWIESQFHVGLFLPAAYPESATDGAAVLKALVKTATDDFFGAVELGAIADAGLRLRPGACFRLHPGHYAGAAGPGNRQETAGGADTRSRRCGGERKSGV